MSSRTELSSDHKRTRTSLASVLLASAIFLANAVNPVEAEAAGALGRPSAAAIELAMNMRPIVHTMSTNTNGGGTSSNVQHLRLAPALLVLESQAGNTSVRDKILQQVQEVTTPGREPGGAGGLTAQDEMAAYSLLALVRNDPVLWAQVDSVTRQRADLVMAAGLVGAAFTTSDDNPFVVARSGQRTIDGARGVGRDWNPNYREGMLGAVLAGRAYFGEAGARQLLQNYDHAAFVTRVRDAGLTNIHTIYSTSTTKPSAGAPTARQIEDAIEDWSVYGIDLSDPMGLLVNLAKDTYSKAVACGLNGGRGVVGTTGEMGGTVQEGQCSTITLIGRQGMIKEFDGSDADGPRSSAFYAYGALKGSLLNQLLVRMTGDWEEGPGADTIRTLGRVGFEDFYKKFKAGYRNFSQGKYQGTLSISNESYHFPIMHSAWYGVLKRNA